MMTVKNLSQEETDIWYKINAEEKGFSGEQIKEKGNSLREKFIKSEEDPSDFFITLKMEYLWGKSIVTGKRNIKTEFSRIKAYGFYRDFA